jgi:hypothetical protein
MDHVFDTHATGIKARINPRPRRTQPTCEANPPYPANHKPRGLPPLPMTQAMRGLAKIHPEGDLPMPRPQPAAVSRARMGNVSGPGGES